MKALLNIFALGVLSLSAAIANAAGSTCDDAWLPALPGPNNTIFAFTVADIGDGAAMYAGGAFTTAGGNTVNYVARWDGQRTGWTALGSGVYDDIIPWIYALTEYDGELIAGGQFTEAGGIPANRIARWNGTQWQPLGGGVSGAVWGLTTHNGQLFASGHFTHADGQLVNRIAGWDGSQWSDLGGGMNGPVFALTSFQGDLIAAGDFTTAGDKPANFIARWDGSQWHALGGGLDHWARALLVHDGKLIVGGRFSTAGSEAASYVASWDGENWSSLGEGISGGFIPPGVEALAHFNGNIIAGGNFTVADGQDASRIARWDGASWHPLGEGANSTVWALIEHDGELHAGGYFTSVDGSSAPHWARWTIAGAPDITAGPSDATVQPGGVAMFSVDADGKELEFQWRHNGYKLEDDERISGSTSELLIIDPVVDDDAGTYDVLVQNTCGTTVSEPATLTVGIPGDLNGDGVVDGADLLILLAAWGSCDDPGDCPADLNGDGIVDGADLLILLANWG